MCLEYVEVKGSRFRGAERGFAPLLLGGGSLRTGSTFPFDPVGVSAGTAGGHGSGGMITASVQKLRFWKASLYFRHNRGGASRRGPE